MSSHTCQNGNLKSEGKIKMFSDIQKLKEFIFRIFALQEMLKVLHTERK